MWDPELADKIGAILNDIQNELPNVPEEERFATLKEKLRVSGCPSSVANNILAAFNAGANSLARHEMDIKAKERRIGFLWGVGFILLLIIIALFIPNPTLYQYTLFRIVLAIAAAGFTNYVEGMLKVQWRFLRAAGPLAVFVIVYYFSPATLVANPPH